MDERLAFPRTTIKRLPKLGSAERFTIYVEGTDGVSVSVSKSEFNLAISDSVLAVWSRNDPGIKPDEPVSKIASKLVELHGTSTDFGDDYLITTENTAGANTLDQALHQMASERQLGEVLPHAGSLQLRYFTENSIPC